MSGYRTVLASGDRGASSVEYGLIAVAIAAAVVVAVFLLGDVVNATLSNSCTTIEGEAATGVDCTP